MHRMFDDYKDRAGELERKIPRMLSIVSCISYTPTISYAQHLHVPVNNHTCPDTCKKKNGGGGIDLLSVLVVSYLSFLQYVSRSIQLKKDLGGLNICYRLCIINTGNYFFFDNREGRYHRLSSSGPTCWKEIKL